MKNLVIYDSDTGTVLRIESKKTGVKTVFVGTGTLAGSGLTNLVAQEGFLDDVLVGDSVIVEYDMVFMYTTKRLKKDENGATVLGDDGFPIVETITEDRSHREPISTEISEKSGSDLVLPVSRDNVVEGSTANVRVFRYVEEDLFDADYVVAAKAAVASETDKPVGSCIVGTRLALDEAEWKFDLGTGKLVFIGPKIEYE